MWPCPTGRRASASWTGSDRGLPCSSHLGQLTDVARSRHRLCQLAGAGLEPLAHCRTGLGVRVVDGLRPGTAGDRRQRCGDRRGVLYFDARLSERYPTIEVRVADVCLGVDDAVLVAGLTRALVMTALKQRATPAPDVPVELLRAASWLASRYGLSGTLLDPVQRRARPAHEVLGALHQHEQSARHDSGDADLVADGLARHRRCGTGADASARPGSTAARAPCWTWSR